MTEQTVRLAVIVGSVRQGRRGPAVANWFAGQAGRREELEVDLVDLADFPLPLALPAFGSEPAPEAARVLEVLSPRLAAADAFVVVTPEYNHSFPAALKNVIDWHGPQWHAKPVGFVSYGGISGGLRAVEQLRLVFAELHAVTVRDTVSFHGVWSRFDDAGAPIGPQECEVAAKVLLDQLTWWARTLREGKAARPYAA
ncbi:NAD(P)H-dependent oxidoreductase [Streptosporangium longisporum]|uniref:NAD(P)H-dependent oxidoreductase n=1 Tax=Streptosporangium longisporum TaxID=46187 RepID=A0ABP6KCM5_9ACTN